MEFYHDLITEKSFNLLRELKKNFDFILIGGWAVFLYTKALKSKDIDIVLDYSELEKFKECFDIFKNERLKKYEAEIEGIDVDIYLPFYSQIGFPLEELRNHIQVLEGFLVPFPEILLILKVFTLKERKGTTKGKKDVLDIFSLLKTEVINWENYKKLIEKYNLQNITEDLKIILKSQTRIPELNLSNHTLARLKKKILEKLL
jgi:hypothetical protein